MRLDLEKAFGRQSAKCLTDRTRAYPQLLDKVSHDETLPGSVTALLDAREQNLGDGLDDQASLRPILGDPRAHQVCP